jgi:cytoskeletal protein CcmA (bactofilin family)
MPIETSKTSKQTLVEEGTEFKGTLKSSCPVVVNGTVDGEVDAPELTITRSGSVHGAIKAKKVKSQGMLSGNVEAGDVFLSGNVRSNTVIKAKSLEVKLGSSEKGQLEVTFGECNIEVGDAQRDEDSGAAWPASTNHAQSAEKEAWPSLPAPASELDSPSPLSPGLPPPAPVGARNWKSSRIIEASAPSSDPSSKTTLR